MTVIVGIQPDVALAMTRLGMGTGNVATALDLEEGIAVLDQVTALRPGADRRG
jgi:rsbT antagonist protein RsbS